MKKFSLLPVILLVIGVFTACNRETPDVRIIPEPASMTIESKMVGFPVNQPIYTSSDDSMLVAAAGYLGEKLGIHGYQIGVPDPGKCIYLELLAPVAGRSPEGYTLITGKDGVTIQASSARGVFYGIQSLLQLLPTEVYAEGGLKKQAGIRIPAVNIQDEPRYAWRGMHLDVGRHLFSVEFIKKYIDLIAMHKMNVFHWHLTEDQGWRIEIKKYPKLTEIGSIRKTADGGTYGGFYTQDQVREVVAYAASRFVDVMPEIEMPGHSVAALAAYPELSCTGGPFEVRTKWGVSDDVYCAGKEQVFEFNQDVLSEVIALFPFKYVHIGGDECPKVRWEKCPACQKRMKEEGLKDEMELQSYFIRRIEKFLETKERRLVGWDEILEGGIAPAATVMSWRGVAGGIEAAKQGHDVIMSPTSHCYFDFYQGDPKVEPKAIGGYLTLEKFYSYEPTPEELTLEEAKHVMGAQANLWTEYISDEKLVEYMVLPRMSAMAEVVWTPKNLRDYEKFTHRMVRQYERLDQMKVNYRVPTPVTKAESFVFTDSLVVSLHNSVLGAEILYTLDGTDPLTGGQVYTEPLIVRKSLLIKAVTRMKSGHSSVPVEIKTDLQEMVDGLTLGPIYPGTDYDLFNGAFSAVKEIDKAERTKSGTLDSPRLPDSLPATDFGLVFRGYLKIDKPAIYRFYLKSDDGSTLMIGDRLVVDNDGPHGLQEKSGEAALGEGWHLLEVRYFQGTGAQSLVLSWSVKGSEKQPVPAANFATFASPMMMMPKN